MLAMGPTDLNFAPYSPVHCSSHSMTSFQSSELTKLPVVENSQLFAQRAHGACTARARRTVRPQNQKWPTNGRIGYITPTVVGVPDAWERGRKLEVAHN